MQTKLTLRLDEALIQKAKAYAHRSGKSVSSLVADFFTLLDSPSGGAEEELTSAVRSLLGALEDTSLTKQDYYRHIEEKY